MMQCDVLVIGAGFAGILASISAAEAGARVILVSSGAICSGSSFYPGTWGFGLVGPESEADAADLEETIVRVGEGVVDRKLVRTFVGQINPGICYLRQMGVPLKEAEHAGEREFIPCFDHKNRSWHGIVKETAGPVLRKRLEELGVETCSGMEVTGLLRQPDGRVCGAEAVRIPALCGAEAAWQPVCERIRLESRTVILASGGLGGLFAHRLNPPDVTGMGQYLAWKAGAQLVNLEFMQMMPAYLDPAYGTVFNEKVFRYAVSEAFSEWSGSERRRLLKLRSSHGPYTSRLESRKVDEALMAAWKQHPEGVKIHYHAAMQEDPPEFVRTYFDWLWETKGLGMADPVRVGIFAHASNGGIRIDCDGRTGVPGLYACGEVTGGMHGADRLGGLSTANALVFGRIAGARAAAEALAAQDTTKALENRTGTKKQPGENDRWRLDCPPRFGKLWSRLGHHMAACAMISRSGEQCEKMLDWLKKEEVQWKRKTIETYDGTAFLDSCRLEARFAMAACMVQAIGMRRESRGSHHRMDFPAKDPGMNRMILVTRGETGPVCQWDKEEEYSHGRGFSGKGQIHI